MKIIRRGARADNGPSSIKLTKITAHHVSTGNEISLQDTDVKDFSTKAHYNYDMRLSYGEIGLIIKALANSSEGKEQAIAAELGPYLRHMMKLSNICIEN